LTGFEATQDGFVLSAGGRRLLSHSRRSPCVEIGDSDNVVKFRRGSSSLGRRRARAVPLRLYKVVERGPDFAAIDFEGRLRMALRFADGRLRISFSRYAAEVSLFRLRIGADPAESLFGCGERFSRIDLKGRRVGLWVEERLPGGEASPFPAPVFISTRGYWCAVDTSAYTVFDFRRRGTTLIDSWAVPRELVVGFGTAVASGGGSPAALIEDMTSVLGRQPAPPDWAYDGAWLGIRGGSEALGRKVETALAAGAKVSAVWVRDWGRERYPRLPTDIARLRARGIRFLGYATPYLGLEGRLYAEASPRGYCVKEPGGRDYLVAASQGATPSALVDLTNPEAYAWIKAGMRREMLDAGMAGWMADFGEHLPADAVLASGEGARSAHNRWPALWAKANREAILEAGKDGEALFFVRSGWLGSARHAAVAWAGGLAPSFSPEGGLPCVVPAGLSLGLSGIGFWHTEAVGAPECLVRWLETSAFSPFFRTGDDGTPGQESCIWADPVLLALLARLSEVYAALKPYHAVTAAEYGKRGLPPIRHPWIHYPEDSEALGLERQYLYGRDLMVAPTLSPGRALTELYLPEDDWVHIWSSRLFRGGRVTVESPLGCPAVFYRASSAFAQLFDALRRTVRRV
jgi:alpha-glucosidase